MIKKVQQLASGALTAVLLGLVATPLYAQLPEHFRDYPLATRGATGESVAPMFNGWIANEDGSITLIFGFANLNREQTINIPLSANNSIEPIQFDGVQPTHFPVVSYRGLVGMQERGAFAVTVPADMRDTEVVWTLTSNGRTYSIPGRATSAAYEMSNGERALGTLKPAIRFSPNGPESTSVEGLFAPRITAKAGDAVALRAYVKDRGNRAGYPENKMLAYPLGTEWVLHQGPAEPAIQQAKISGRDRAAGAGESGRRNSGWEEVSTLATFTEPGDYVIRLRVDNFTAPDSQFDNVCCWSNAYVPVTVTQ